MDTLKWLFFLFLDILINVLNLAIIIFVLSFVFKMICKGLKFESGFNFFDKISYYSRMVFVIIFYVPIYLFNFILGIISLVFATIVTIFQLIFRR